MGNEGQLSNPACEWTKAIDFLPLCPPSLSSNHSQMRPGTSLVIQWLSLHAPQAGAPCSIPGQETRCHMPQLKIQCSQIKIYIYFLKSSMRPIEKQRHYFANKGLSSQGYGFSSGHVWM